MSSSGVEKRGSGATVRACDACRRRKRKCAWTPSAVKCTPCVLSKDECSTTHVRKPRARSEKQNRVAEYESRIQRLESLLEERSAAQPQVQDQPLQPADRSMTLSTWVGTLRDEVDSWPLKDLGAPVIEAGFEVSEENSTLSLSSASSLAQTRPEEGSNLHPPDINDPLAEFQNDPSFLQDLSLRPTIPVNYSEHGIPPPLPRVKCDGSLPSPELGTSLLSEFLIDFNTAIPLFRPYEIAEHLRTCYMGGSDGTAISWAIVNILLGIAHRLRAMSAAANPEDNEQADYYLARCLAKVPDLLLAPPSLALVQTLLGVAILIQTSSHSTSHASFVSTALRIAQSLAYNDDQTQVTDPGQDIEQQRRVFWIAFVMDTDQSILSNAPTTHRRDDIAASRPEDDPQDAAGAVTAAEGTWRVNIFSLRARLALLQAEAIEQVLSVKGRKRAPQDISMFTTTMLQKLQSWRNHELFQLNAEQLMQLLYRSDLVHVLGLEASYFATVFRLQAFLVLGMDTRVNPFSVDALTKLSEQKQHPCRADAKRFLNLLSVAPQGDIGVCWMIKLPVTAALVTVMAHTLHYPLDDAPGDVEMRDYGKILRMLGTLAQKSPHAEFRQARGLCMMLFSKVDAARRVRERHVGASGGWKELFFDDHHNLLVTSTGA